MKIHEYNEMMAYLTRPRRNFLEGGDIIPKKKPLGEEANKILWNKKLDRLKELKGGVGRRDWLNMISEHLNNGLRQGVISKEQFNRALMPLFGEAGETQTRALEKDPGIPIKDRLDLYGEDREDYPKYHLAKGGVIGEGGMIQGKDMGYRTGFAGPELITQGINKNSYFVQNTITDPISKKRKPIRTYFKVDDYGSLDEAKKAAEEFYQARMKLTGKLRGAGRLEAVEAHTKAVNNWVDNWINTNIENYGLRDVDDFLKNMVDDLKKSEGKFSKTKALFRKGFPNIGDRKSKLPFKAFDLPTLNLAGTNPNAGENFFKRLFYADKINKDPILKKRIGEYMEYITLDKKGIGPRQLGDLKNYYSDTLNNLDDVMYVLSKDIGLESNSAKALFEKLYPDSYTKYRDKMRASAKNYLNNVKKIEDKLGPKRLKQILGGKTSIIQSMADDGKELSKIFDVSQLPKGADLGYSVEHNLGISEISRMDDINDMEQALKSLRGMTTKRNRDLGWSTYSNRRKKLRNDISKGINVTDNLDDLNNLTKTLYPELKGKNAYKLVDGIAKPTKDFTYLTDVDTRFSQYFEDLATDPRGKAELIRQTKVGPNPPKLKEFVIRMSTAETIAKEGIEICTTGGGAVMNTGGRVGYGKKCYKGAELMKFARENPEQAIQAFKASKEVNASMAKNPSKWLKAGRWTARELGPLGIIGGELIFGGAMTMMELGQGKNVWEAMDNGFLYGLAGVEDKVLMNYAKNLEGITDEEIGYTQKILDMNKLAPGYHKILQTMSKMDPTKLTSTEGGARGVGEGRERPTAYARYKILADKKLAEIEAIKGDMTEEQATLGQGLFMMGQTMKGLDEEGRRKKREEALRQASEASYALGQIPLSMYNQGGRVGLSGGAWPGMKEYYEKEVAEDLTKTIDDLTKDFKKYRSMGGKKDLRDYMESFWAGRFYHNQGGRAGFGNGSEVTTEGASPFPYTRQTGDIPKYIKSSGPVTTEGASPFPYTRQVGDIPDYTAFAGTRYEQAKGIDESKTARELKREERRVLAEKISKYLKFPPAHDEKGNPIPTFSKTGKQQIEGLLEGITSDKEIINFITSLDIPITDKINLLGELGYGEIRDKIEYEGNEIYLKEASGKSRKVGIGYNEEGEGFSGHLKYDIDSGEPEAYFQWSKKYNQGGRVGFDRGAKKPKKPKDPSKRLFLKGIGALALIPFIGRYFKLAKMGKTKSYLGPTIENVKGMPEWFPSLVKKLWKEGDDVTKTAAWKDRQVVKRGTLENGDEVDLVYDMDTGNVSVEVVPKKGTHETTSGAYNKEYSLDYQKGQADEMTKGKKPPDEFKVTETEPVRTGHPDDPDWDWDGVDTNVDDAITDLTELEAFAKSKSTKQIHKKKGTKTKDVNPEVEYPEYDYGDYDID